MLNIISLRRELHSRYYQRIKNRKYLAWWFNFLIMGNDFLPLYMDIPFTRYTLAAWSDDGSFKESRITLRERGAGLWMATIKAGNYEDQKRVSKYFFTGHPDTE